MKIGILVGSLRKESFNRKTAKALIAAAPTSLQMEIIEIGDLPLYNEDLEGDRPPPTWTAFRERVKSCEGIIFATPEYNRSVPAVLKNAIDVGSRPYGASVWDRKSAAVISVSLGAIGGFGANHHLRQSLVTLNMPTMQQPEAYIGNASTLFDANGTVINEKTKEVLKKFIEAYAAWAEKTRS